MKKSHSSELPIALVGVMIFSGLISFLTGCSRDKADIRIMAAASLSDVFLEISEAFEAETGLSTSLYTAGSATLATQITEGAEANVIALANEQTMNRIVDSGHVETEFQIQIFASTHLALVTPLQNPGSITSFSDIQGKKLAVCSQVVPCGALSYAFAEQEDIRLDPVSMEPNVRSVRTKVELGEVDAGLIYISDVTSKMKVIDIPELKDLKTMYPIAVLRPAELTAKKFMDFVLSQSGQAILNNHGFGKSYEN